MLARGSGARQQAHWHGTPPPQDVVVLRYLLSAAGDVTTSDVDLAAASGGMIVAFNLEPDEAVLAHAKRLGAHKLGRRCSASVRAAAAQEGLLPLDHQTTPLPLQPLPAPQA